MENKYFLAANSADGFYSEFDKAFNAKDNWLCYIIKGGAGTGKSSFMKKLYLTAKDKNIKAIPCMCSSDPNSLDAVIFPDIKKIIMDGTAPHTVDPKFPAACEQIINTGEFWDSDKLQKNREEIINLTEKNSSFHKLAAMYIKAAGKAARNNFSIALRATDIEKCISLAVRYAEKYMPVTDNFGYRWVRFLGGITPNGVIHYTDTINQFKNKIFIRDEYGASASIILSVLADIALTRGYETITIKNELLPSLITDALIIPSLNFAFCRETGSIDYGGDTKRINYSRFTDMLLIKENRQKLKYNKKICNNLIDSAVDNLKYAKSTHDDLEKYYIEAMDFDALNKYYKNFEEKFF